MKFLVYRAALWWKLMLKVMKADEWGRNIDTHQQTDPESELINTSFSAKLFITTLFFEQRLRCLMFQGKLVRLNEKAAAWPSSSAEQCLKLPWNCQLALSNNNYIMTLKSFHEFILHKSFPVLFSLDKMDLQTNTKSVLWTNIRKIS